MKSKFEEYLQSIKSEEVKELLEMLRDFMVDNKWGETQEEAESDLLKILNIE